MQALGYFNSLAKPAVFIPGDNDRADCDRTRSRSRSSSSTANDVHWVEVLDGAARASYQAELGQHASITLGY